VRGPSITLTCDCGETGRVRYGERWTCPGCSRVWDTAQIPEEEYAGLMRDLRLYKLVPVAIALLIAAAFVPLIVFVNEGLALLLPLLLGALAIFLGPVWKKRVRRRVAAAPTWNLRPE
jgi:hypothetical protein